MFTTPHTFSVELSPRADRIRWRIAVLTQKRIGARAAYPSLRKNQSRLLTNSLETDCAIYLHDVNAACQMARSDFDDEGTSGVNCQLIQEDATLSTNVRLQPHRVNNVLCCAIAVLTMHGKMIRKNVNNE